MLDKKGIIYLLLVSCLSECLVYLVYLNLVYLLLVSV